MPHHDSNPRAGRTEDDHAAQSGDNATQKPPQSDQFKTRSATRTWCNPARKVDGRARGALRSQAERHLSIARHPAGRKRTPPNGWACVEHKIPAGETCSLCADQLGLFGSLAGDDQ